LKNKGLIAVLTP